MVPSILSRTVSLAAANALATTLCAVVFLMQSPGALAQTMSAAFDAAVFNSDTETYYLFSGQSYVRKRYGEPTEAPRSVTSWDGWPWPDARVDAVVYNSSRDVYYFFRDGEYARKPLGQPFDDGYPRPITGWSGWPSAWGTGPVDAVIYNDKRDVYYLFRGEQYVRHSHGGPADFVRTLGEGWPGWSPGLPVDAATFVQNADAYYFFSASQYAKKESGEDFGGLRSNDDGWLSGTALGAPDESVRSAAEDYMGFSCGGRLSGRVDGCSNPGDNIVANNYRGLFGPACNRHDACYSSPWREAGIQGMRGQAACDNAFLTEMRTICDEADFTLGGLAKAECQLAAMGFYAGVDRRGGDAFTRGQAWASQNCSVTGGSITPNGVIHVNNEAGYVAWFDVTYTLNGERVTRESGRFPLGQGRTIEIPANATNVHLELNGDFAGSALIDERIASSGADVSECLRVYGTVFDAEYTGCR